MDNNQVRSHLDSASRVLFDSAISHGNAGQAVSILIRAGLRSEAVDFYEQVGDDENAFDIAMQCKLYERAVVIARRLGDRVKLADVLLLMDRKEEAAQTFAQIQQYDKAAKIYMQVGQYDLAADLYAQSGKYMNALMCYQKTGNTAKQLEMQIAAFESQLALANGDLTTVGVSRTMAIHAAKALLDNPETIVRGLDILEKAQALESCIPELLDEGAYLKAGYCYERLNRFDEARRAYIKANDESRALLMSQEIGGDSVFYTLQALKRYFQLGVRYISLKRYDEALEALKQINPDDPDYSGGLELQGDIYCKRKNFNDAVLCYESLMWRPLPPDRMCKVAFKAGYSYEALGDLENALKSYKKIREIDPGFNDVGSLIQKLTERIQASADNGREMKEQPGLSPVDTGSVRMSPSAGILRLPSSTRSDRVRTKVSTITVDNHALPLIGNERYQIIEEVAHGGMGVVYKATDTILMRTVGLKVLANKLKDNKVALEYFMREARASAALQHVNIVTIYDIGSLNDGSIYLAMEFIEGKTLKQIVAQTGAFPTKFLVQIATHACRGLQYAHDNGIIHRDVKSSNIMLAKKDKMLKILDMGLAKMVTDEDQNCTQAIGTPYYMSPEQVLGTTIDCRADIYSLGVTLYECATGVLPFVKGDLPYKHVHEPPPPLRTFNENVNPDIERIILKMMAKQPDDRYPSCNDVIAALRDVRYCSDDRP